MIPLLVILLTIHGTNAIHGESYPDLPPSEFVVAIWYFMEHKCTGSILDRVHILTAGHCVTEKPTASLSVAARVHEPQDMQVIEVKTVHFHPDFRMVCPGDNFYWENDIAVVKLSAALNWEPTITAAILIDKGDTWGLGEIRRLYGWVESTVNDVELLTLQWSYAIVMKNEFCRALDVDLLENEACLQTPIRSTVLDDGDHGAPVMSKSIVIGITIRGGENESSPPVFLDIYPYLDFIASVINVKDINIPGIFAHYVAIFYNGMHLCGGSIIDSTHILSVAHCFPNMIADNLTVLPGHNEFFIERLHARQLFRVDRIQIHPDHGPAIAPNGESILINDIAVLTLKVPLAWSVTIRAIGLADYLPDWKTCQLYRWSRTTTRQGEKLTQSLWSSALIYDHDTCKHIACAIASTQFCVLSSYSLPIAAAGDSGSPIVCDGTSIVGVYNGAAHLDRQARSPLAGYFFTSVLPHREFISLAVADRI